MGDESVIEACIEALTDSNEFVRDFAGKTLERVTHEDFGYQPEASPRRREQAQEKWRKWWASEKDELEKSRGLANPPPASPAKKESGAGSRRTEAGSRTPETVDSEPETRDRER